MSNNSTKGWLKFHRTSEDNELYFSEPFTRWQAWQDMILLANHKDGKAIVRGNIIIVKKGQLGYAVKTLSHRWKWSQGKVNRFLEYLKNGDQILYEKTALTTIVTIKNWDKYQGDGEQTESKRRANREQTETNKNDKEINIKNIYNDFFDLFISITGKNIKTLNEKTKGQINARLADGYTLSDFETAIRNCKADRYHIENPKYLTPEFITRPDKFEKYVNASAPVKTVTSESFFGV